MVYDDNVLSEKINEAFVNVMQECSPLPENVRVASVDDEPFGSVTEATGARKLKVVSTSRAGGPNSLPNWILDSPQHLLPGM